MAPSSPEKHATPSRPSALPSLLAGLRTPSSASVASSTASTTAQESLPHKPTRSREVSQASGGSRSPSMRSLADAAASSDIGGGRAKRTMRSVSGLSKTTDDTKDRSEPERRRRSGKTRSRSSSSSSAGSQASSASSLEGLAQRLQGARKGKTRGARVGEAKGSGKAKGWAEEAHEDAGEGDPAPHNGVENARLHPPDPTALVDSAASPSSSPSTSTRLFDLPRTSSPSLPEASSATAESLNDASFAHDDDEANEDDDDLADDDSASVVFRSEGQPDPRDMLRAQLARAPPSTMSVEQRRRDEKGKGKGKAVELDVEEKEVELRPASREEALAGLPRRYFVLSTAGKLVYTSDDDEEAATGLVGVMQAIISIFADEGDKIRYVDVGQTRISFLLKPPLYLVVVSSQGEPENILRMHLDYLYLQVLSVVTHAQLQAIFAKRTNFDLRRMMEGTEPFFDSLVSTLQGSLPMLLSSIEVYRLPTSTRDDLARALNPGREVIRDLDLLYVLLLAKGRLVSLLRPKKHSIHPTDLHLLLSTIYAKRKSASPSPLTSPALNGDPPPPRPPRSSPLLEPGAESWLPICLPRFNPRGFLHAYISFFDVGSSGRSADGGAAEPPEDGVGLVLLSSQRDSFLGVKSAAEGIKARLLASPSASSPPNPSSTLPPPAPDGGLLHPLLLFRARQSYSLGELAVPGLRHFVYKDKAKVQVTMCGWEGEYGGEEGSEGEKARRRLITLYQHLHTALHPRPAAAGAPARQAAQVQYLRTEHEAVLGWITSSFELYLATAPLLPHSAVVNAARAISKFVAGKENELFLSNAPSF